MPSNPPSSADAPASDYSWKLFMKLQGNSDLDHYSPVRLLAGSEELSALYSYEVLVFSTPHLMLGKKESETLSEEEQNKAAASLSSSTTARALLGKRATFRLLSTGAVTAKTDVNTPNDAPAGHTYERILKTVHGVIMSVESRPADSSDSGYPHDAVWFKLTIRPSLARACYTRHRQVYNASALDSSTSPNPGRKLLEQLAARWDTTLVIANNVTMPQFLQLVQNDESDYNFLTRVLASWGLGFAWGEADNAQKTAKQESLLVFSMVNAECPAFTTSDPKNPTCLYDDKRILPYAAVTQKATHHWTASYGYQNADVTLITPQDEAWDQLQDGTPAVSAKERQLATQDNQLVCEGSYLYNKNNTAGHSNSATNKEHQTRVDSARCIGLGLKASLPSGEQFYQTRLDMTATRDKWKVDISGRIPVKDKGLGILPRPVRLNVSPDTCAEELIAGAPCPQPAMRSFMAVVVDESYTDTTDSGKQQKRNLCKVQEILSFRDGSPELGDSLWVEMGSPFADADSGFLARPRKGNVLFCLDRGDLSIPVVLSAMFRNNNATPLASLKALDRRKLKNATENPCDYSALTLRNRTHTPARIYTDSSVQATLKAKRKAETEARGETYTESAANISSAPVDESVDKPEDVTRPISVTELAKGKYAFNQIQMVSRDNGVKPVEQRDAISKTYLSSGVIETVAGFISEADMSTGYAMANMAQAAQLVYNSPVTRPHFEGINMFSAKDVLLQSADHQIVNAGGEIVLTAAQGITLRVGKSSIKITEAGVELVSGCGLVHNPGAHQAYCPEGEAQETHTMAASSGSLLGGRIWIDTSGVSTKGPYVSNTAINVFSATTFLGSNLTITDFSAKLFSPNTTIVGGAAAVDTAMNAITQGVFGGLDILTAIGGSETCYSAPLQDGWKAYGPGWGDFLGSGVGAIFKTISQVGGYIGALNKLKDAVSITGSMIKMEPKTMTVSSSHYFNYQDCMTQVNTPVAGYVAMGERSGVAGKLKTVSGELAKLGKAGSAGVAAGVTLGGAAAGAVLGAMLAPNPANSDTSEDTFTSPNATQPKFRNGSPDGSAMGIAAGVAGAVLGVATGVGLFVANLLPKAVNFIANVLFLHKQNVVAGVKQAEGLREHQTFLQGQTQRLDDKKLVINEKDIAARVEMAKLLSEDKEASGSKACVVVEMQSVSSTEQSASSSHVEASSSEVAANASSTEGIHVETGTTIST